MKHTDIAVGEIVYIRAKKTEDGYKYRLFWNDLELAITENELLSLKEKAEKNECKEFIPVVWEEYEFSDWEKEWKKNVFLWYRGSLWWAWATWKNIRPIQ